METWRNDYTRDEVGTYCEVRFAADVCLCEGVDGLCSYPKVTEFDLATLVDKDIGWFDIWGRGGGTDTVAGGGHDADYITRLRVSHDVM